MIDRSVTSLKSLHISQIYVKLSLFDSSYCFYYIYLNLFLLLLFELLILDFFLFGFYFEI